MSFCLKDPFEYMGDKGFLIFSDGEVRFDDDVPQELRDRLLADLANLRKETAERHAKGIYTDMDYY